MVNVFSVPAFFIVLREVLEACLVVGIVLAYLKKTGATHLNKVVWWGAGSGIAVSLAFGIGFVVTFYVNGNKIFAGTTEKIFEGIVFLIAAALLTWMILWMAYMGKKLQEGIEKQVEGFIEADGRQGKIGLFFMVFVQVLREGIETWIFLFGAASSADKGPNAWRAIPIPGILALVVGLFLSYAVFRGMVNLDVTKFFLWSSIILMAFSAGLVSHAFHELQEAAWFGPWNSGTKDWYNARMWSTKDCCNDKYNEFFAFLRALFGYQDTPTFLEWVTYFAYWVVIGTIMIAFNWEAIRAAKRSVAKHTRNLAAVSLLFTFVGFIYSIGNAVWNGVLVMTLAFVLSITGVTAAFDIISDKVRSIGKLRRVLALGTGVGLGLLTLFMSVLHIVQMGCDESTTCNIPKFYYFGLIFDQDWAMGGRKPNSWVSIAVLSWSLVISFFFFGSMSFFFILFANNVDGDGVYQCDNEPVKVSGGSGEEGEIHSSDSTEMERAAAI